MLRQASIVALALTLAAAGSAAEPEPAFTLADPATPLAASGEVIASDPDRYSRMTIPVTIEGAGPFRFMIDTGSQATVVSRALRDRLGLPSIGQATVVGMAARKEVELVRLDGLEFASRMFDALHAPLLEAQHIGADGIIGLDSLQDLRVLIDFRGKTIAVDDAAALGGDRGYEIVVRARNKKGRLIITDAEIDGVRTAVVLDTGSQGSMGNTALQRRLRTRKGSPVTSTDVTGATVSGRLDAGRTLQIGGRTSSGRLQLEG
ncbi:MAG: aspartyl protease family protein, partial [Cypionkella sp.]